MQISSKQITGKFHFSASIFYSITYDICTPRHTTLTYIPRKYRNSPNFIPNHVCPEHTRYIGYAPPTWLLKQSKFYTKSCRSRAYNVYRVRSTDLAFERICCKEK